MKLTDYWFPKYSFIVPNGLFIFIPKTSSWRSFFSTYCFTKLYRLSKQNFSNHPDYTDDWDQITPLSGLPTFQRVLICVLFHFFSQGDIDWVVHRWKRSQYIFWIGFQNVPCFLINICFCKNLKFSEHLKEEKDTRSLKKTNGREGNNPLGLFYTLNGV